jgi:hypothetical protein
MERQPGVALSPWYFSNVEFDAWDANSTEHNMNSDFYVDYTLFNGGGSTMASSSYVGYPDIANYNFTSSN